MDFGGLFSTQQPYGQMPQQQQMPQQSSGWFSSTPQMSQQSSGFFGSSTQQSPVAAQVTNIVPRLSSPNPQDKLAAASQLEALAKTEIKLAENQIGIPRTGMRTGMRQDEYGMGASGMGASRMGTAVYGGKRRYRTHHRRKQSGGSCSGVASHAATFKGGRRRKRNGKKRTHRRR